MTTSRFIAAIADHLRRATATEKAVVSVAADHEEALARLGAQAPDRLGVCLLWQGYGGPPDDDVPEWQTNEVSVFVRVPVGLPAVPGDALIKGEHNVLDRIDWICQLVRAMRFDHDDIDARGVRLTKSEWHKKDEKGTTRVHELRFEIVMQMAAAPGTLVKL